MGINLKFTFDRNNRENRSKHRSRHQGGRRGKNYNGRGKGKSHYTTPHYSGNGKRNGNGKAGNYGKFQKGGHSQSHRNKDNDGKTNRYPHSTRRCFSCNIQQYESIAQNENNTDNTIKIRIKTLFRLLSIQGRTTTTNTKRIYSGSLYDPAITTQHPIIVIDTCTHPSGCTCTTCGDDKFRDLDEEEIDEYDPYDYYNHDVNYNNQNHIHHEYSNEYSYIRPTEEVNDDQSYIVDNSDQIIGVENMNYNNNLTKTNVKEVDDAK